MTKVSFSKVYTVSACIEKYSAVFSKFPDETYVYAWI